MNLGQYALTLGAVPFFATRLFLTTFLLALTARLAQSGYLDFLERLGPFDVKLAFDLPWWLIHPTSLYVLAVLAVLESLKEKDSTVRSFFDLIDAPAKGFGSLIVTSGVTVSAGLGAAAGGVYMAGLSPEALWAIVPAGLVWWLASIRLRIYAFLDELDPEDDLRVQRLLSWAEDGWVTVGVLMFVIFPLIALGAAAVTGLGLAFVAWRLKARETALRSPCPACANRNHLSALTCGACKRDLPEPKRIGFWGQPKKALVRDVEEHRLRLLAKKRCADCATPLPARSVRQPCAGCGRTVFAGPDVAEAYVQRLNRRLVKTLVIATAMSAVPFLGIVPGIIYYRLSLLSGLRGYVPYGRNVVVLWLLRIVTAMLLAFQWLPLFGALSLPAMCLLSFWVYRNVFRGECARKFARATV